MTQMETLLNEIGSSVRMLLRDAITRPQGGGVPPGELFAQIRKLDEAMGKGPHKKPSKKSTHNHVDVDEAFNKPMPMEPEPKPPKNGKAETEGPLLVLRNGKWHLKK